MLRNNADVRRCSYLSLGYLCFPERKCIFLSLEENLWTINRKKEFPDFSLTLTISKIFPDLEKFWFSPDVSLTVATLVPGWYLRGQIHWHLNKKWFFLPTFIHYTGTKPILATGYMHSKSTFTRNTQLLKTSVFMQKNMLQYVNAGMDVKSSRIQSLPLPFLTSALFKLSICQHINLLKISIFPFKKLF